MNSTHLPVVVYCQTDRTLRVRNLRRGSQGRRGFTLLEILLVLAILGAIASVLVPDLLTRQNKANRDTAILTLQSAEQALKMYLIDHQGRWPDIKSGIDVLLEPPPNDPQWFGPYLTSGPVDPWGQKLLIQSSRQKEGQFTFYSVGPDGREGTDDDVVIPTSNGQRNS